jgi:ABC-type antimicrobial peptide transport system permease subunit
MKLGALVSLVGQNVVRSKRNFAMSGFGIVVGISTFVFFIGLGQGIKRVVLERIFLANQVEVVRKKFDTGIIETDSILGVGGTRPLDDAAVKMLAGIPGVDGVYPKMKFAFPTRGWGGKRLLGRDVWAEIIADGIEPDLVKDELENAGAFRDWDAELSCQADTDCPDGRTCQGGTCHKSSCTYVEDTNGGCPGESYCAEDTQQCETPIPVLVSNALLELYNGSLATAMSGGTGKMPRLSKKAVIGFGLNVTFGRSFLGESRKSKPITRRLKLIGFSDKAITVGVTLPIGYVRRLNAQFAGDDAAGTYGSIILDVKDQGRVPTIAQQVKAMGFDLADKTEKAEQAGMLINIITLVFSLISVIIVAIAAVNISHTFFMIILQRKREIGVLRALGASRGDVRTLILGEATLIGLTGGALGALAGWGAARAADLLGNRLPDFPFKPDTFFAFPSWLWGAAAGFAVVFCVVGAFFPANAAARLEPAEALVN